MRQDSSCEYTLYVLDLVLWLSSDNGITSHFTSHLTTNVTTEDDVIHQSVIIGCIKRHLLLRLLYIMPIFKLRCRFTL